MGRKPCCDKVGLKRGPWTIEEDHKLMNFIFNNGTIPCWRNVSKLAGLLRCGKSCRLRWINYLRPDLKRGCFTDIEEDEIIRLHSQLGNRWSKIASHFRGRTDNEIKNHWNTKIKKKLKLLGLDPVTHKPIEVNSEKIDGGNKQEESLGTKSEDVSCNAEKIDGGNKQEEGLKLLGLDPVTHKPIEVNSEKIDGGNKQEESLGTKSEDVSCNAEKIDGGNKQEEGLGTKSEDVSCKEGIQVTLDETNDLLNSYEMLFGSFDLDYSYTSSFSMAETSSTQEEESLKQWVDSVDSFLSWDNFVHLEEENKFISSLGNSQIGISKQFLF